MRKWYALLFFLTIWMRPFGYTIEPVQIQSVDNCIVTLVGEDRQRWATWSDEAWRVGDRAEAIIARGQVIELRMDWNKPKKKYKTADTFVLWELKGHEVESLIPDAVDGELLIYGEDKRPKQTGHH